MLYWIFDLDDTLYQINIPQRVNNGLYMNYSFIKENKTLKTLLKFLSGKKVIMTNSIQAHCTKVLKKLKLNDGYFDSRFHRDTLMNLKPHPYTYAKLIKDMGIKKEDTCIFFDDTPINLIMAKKFGWTTVLITPHPWKFYHNSIDMVFPNINNALVFLIKKKIDNLNNKTSDNKEVEQ
jgi:FMN phosphatase YigB (HAD superfamily)